MNTESYDLLATLLAYPSDQTRRNLERVRALLPTDVRSAGECLDRFAKPTISMTTETLQELYTQTFDLNPTCSLEVGWQLYGENYARGAFLVAMRQSLRRLGVTETTELPDHLTHVLSAFGRMDSAEARRFSAEFLLPALEKMLEGLGGKENPYADLLAATEAVIRSAYPPEVIEDALRRRSRPLPLVEPTPEVCHG